MGACGSSPGEEMTRAPRAATPRPAPECPRHPRHPPHLQCTDQEAEQGAWGRRAATGRATLLPALFHRPQRRALQEKETCTGKAQSTQLQGAFKWGTAFHHEQSKLKEGSL